MGEGKRWEGRQRGAVGGWEGDKQICRSIVWKDRMMVPCRYGLEVRKGNSKLGGWREAGRQYREYHEQTKQPPRN